MNKNLILITGAFPFQAGEEFLVTESEYLNVFNNVYICPAYADKYDACKKYNRNCRIVIINKKGETFMEKLCAV